MKTLIDCPDCGPGTADENGYCARCGMCLVTLPDEPAPKKPTETTKEDGTP